jgi:ATP-dependent helicase HrpB
LGDEVGYQIRFENVTSPQTRICFVTEGILMRRMLADPHLSGVGAVIFDEFHERSIHTDLGLALALRLQEERRSDLWIGVMSATLDSQVLKERMPQAQHLRAEGRVYPVEIRFLPKDPDFAHTPVWEVAADAWESIAAENGEGDVLVFMPGTYEIHRTIEAIRSTRAARDCAVLPLHGELPPRDQDAALGPSDRRKIIVATNVAETSLTIEGVRWVVDSGLARMARHDPVRGINTLLIEKISRSSAEQRAGRAGRTAPGVCCRLWSQAAHAARPHAELPEVRRVELSEAVMALKGIGVGNVWTFPWIEPPESRSLERSLELLQDLGALPSDDQEAPLTQIGRQMCAFPSHPRIARMLIEAGRRRCVRAAALVAALTQGRGLWVRSQDRGVTQRRDELFGDEAMSDLLPMMRAWTYAQRCGFDPRKCGQVGIHAQSARQATAAYEQILAVAANQSLPVDADAAPDDALGRCVLAAFADHLAVRMDGGTLRCQVVHGRRGNLRRDTVVRDARMVVACEIHEIGRSNGLVEVELAQITAIQEEWMAEMFPDQIHAVEEVVWDEHNRRVVARAARKFRDLSLDERDGIARGERAAQILAEHVESGECPLRAWDDAVEQWIARVNFAAGLTSGSGFSAMGPEERRWLIARVCDGASSYKEVKDREVWPVLRSWLSKDQEAALDKCAPAQLPLPSGRKGKIRYGEAGGPVLSARIQDLFGVENSLRIGYGQVVLTVEILAPNFRPVQVTRDLALFWRETYPRLRQELQRKYPKHHWK